MTSPIITIDTIKEEDLDEIVKLGGATPEVLEDDDSPYYSKKELSSFIKSPDDIYLVAKIEGKIAGYRLATFNRYLKEAYLIDLVVKRQYRGLGVASKLYKKTFEILNKKDCTWIWVLVKDTNTRMMEILKKKGFTKGDGFSYFYKLPPY